jgi:hypothetical protein
MNHLFNKENIALCSLRQARRGQTDTFFAAQGLICKDIVSIFDIGTVFPLYLYPNGETGGQAELVPQEDGRRPNLSFEFVNQFAEAIGLEFVADGHGDLKKTFGPEDVFNYIYAIFHSQTYRDRYAEFLKLDFPRVLVTSERRLFSRLCASGGKLAALHIMQESNTDDVSFDIPGENVVEKVAYVPPLATKADASEKSDLPAGKMGRVYINAKQYFEGITPSVWTFCIGGYQVCEKWLKDRKGRMLGADEIEHYQRTVSALAETRTLMAQIDSLIADHGGWPLK